jgi:predicted MFS family arabinose efflux permease
VVDRPTPGVVLREAGEGMRWLWHSRPVRTVIIAGAGLTFFTQTWEPLLVLISVNSGGSSAAGFGLILAIGAVGGIAGAIVTPALIHRYSNESLQIAALATVAFSDFALAAYPTPAMAAITLTTVSFAFAVWNVLSTTLRQRLVPATVLGRVNAASRTLSMMAAPTGAIAGGALAAVFGLSAPLWVSGGALVVIAIAYAATKRPRALTGFAT